MSDDLAAQFVTDLTSSVEAGDFDAQLDNFMADTVVPAWVGNAPEDSGNYKNSVEVVEAAQAGKGRVAATVDYANLVEYGTADTPEYAPMARTVEQLNRRESTL